ncbi:MAG: ComF family protein [Candidatus Hydrogenedentes bacterium]|nr:ComF family protein [Candidatus Hydrogenedentota bacterium]
MSNPWVLAAKNLLFPSFCQACGERLLTEENGYFCPDCWDRSPRIERPFCPQCGRPHPRGVGLQTGGSNFFCEPCRNAKNPPPCEHIAGAAYYTGAVEAAVKLMKFNDKPRLARPLAEVMAGFALKELDCDDYDCLTPVPLHHVRERDRGFNQSRLLADHLAGYFPNAAVAPLLKRVRPTLVQSRLRDQKERLANVRGAFDMRPGVDAAGKTVLLIDDVVTTGGTVSECARVLKMAGAARVDVLAAALAVPLLTPEPAAARGGSAFAWPF